MTAYTTLHFAGAAVCAFMAVLHLGIWAADRTDKIAPSTAGSFAFLVPLVIGIGGWSRAAEGAAGGPLGYWILAALAVPAASFYQVTAWRLFRRPIGRTQLTLLAVPLVLLVARNVSIAWNGVPATWEETLDPKTFLGASLWVSSFVIIGTWIGEALRSIQVRRGFGWIVAQGTLPLLALFLWEAIQHGAGSSRASLYALSSLPFVLLGPIRLATQFVRSAKRAREGGDVGRYRMVRHLGAGGMGEIFLATRTGPAGFERPVVVKRMRAGGDASLVERFLSEARLAAQLQHPNIVSVFDMGRTEDGWFLVMEHLPGMSLAQILDRRRGNLPIGLALFAGEHVCRGLDAAHAAGIVHRDISSHNVMATFAGEIKIVDFGIAKARGTDEVPLRPAPYKAGTELTEAGTVLGKVAYLAPERFGGGEALPPSDLYSLGVVLFELITGRRPFPAGRAAVLDLAYDKPPAITVLRPDTPPALAELVERTLARDPSSRPASARDMAAAVRAASEGFPPFDLATWLQSEYPKEATVSREATIATPDVKATR